MDFLEENNMKKLISAVLALAMLMSLTACGGNTATEPATEPAASVEMSCEELSRAFLAFTGYKPFDYVGFKLSGSQVKRLNAVMQTCGFYDEAGEFSYLVGLPGKSGVGGGIIAIYPHKYSVAVWSPRLNSKGNSIMGMKALELLTTYTAESIF